MSEARVCPMDGRVSAPFGCTLVHACLRPPLTPASDRPSRLPPTTFTSASGADAEDAKMAVEVWQQWRQLWRRRRRSEQPLKAALGDIRRRLTLFWASSVERAPEVEDIVSRAPLVSRPRSVRSSPVKASIVDRRDQRHLCQQPQCASPRGRSGRISAYEIPSCTTGSTRR